jgi:hypothetical protein
MKVRGRYEFKPLWAAFNKFSFKFWYRGISNLLEAVATKAGVLQILYYDYSIKRNMHK